MKTRLVGIYLTSLSRPARGRLAREGIPASSLISPLFTWPFMFCLSLFLPLIESRSGILLIPILGLFKGGDFGAWIHTWWLQNGRFPIRGRLCRRIVYLQSWDFFRRSRCKGNNLLLCSPRRGRGGWRVNIDSAYWKITKIIAWCLLHTGK